MTADTIRLHRRNRFAIIDRRALADPKLSWKAKGILAYCLGLPDGATIDRATLATIADDDVPGSGETAVRGALRELQNAGYLVRTKGRDANGRVTWDTVLYEYPPQVENHPVADETTRNDTDTTGGFSTGGKPSSKREDLSNKDNPSLVSRGDTGDNGDDDGDEPDGAEPGYNADGSLRAANAIRRNEYPTPFERTWDLWPKGRRRGKRGTYRAWRAAVHRLADDDDLKQIDAMRTLWRSTARYIDHQQALGTELRFFKMPATFYGPDDHFRDYMPGGACYDPSTWGNDGADPNRPSVLIDGVES